MIRTVAFLAALSLASPAFAATRAATAPRPISAAERAAVELAIAYAERGPAAWRERLAPGSSLAALDAAAIEDEIAVRCGPAAGAVWQLQTPGPAGTRDRAIFTIEFPSGVDETLELRMEQAERSERSEQSERAERAEQSEQARGGWRIASLRSLADPAPRPSATAAAAPESPTGRGQALLLAAAALLGVGALAVRVPRRRALRWASGGLGAATLLLVAGACLDRPSGSTAEEETREAPRPWLRLAALSPLRLAIVAGSDRATIERESARRPTEAELARVADLWRAQLAIVDGDLATAGALLERPTADREDAPPLAALLAARHALLRLDGASATWSYQRAVEAGPDHDGLRLEAIQAERLAGEDARSAVELQILIERGTRLAEPWYGAAGEALLAERPEQAESLIRTGWELAPLAREELFDDPVIAALVARPNVFPLLDLGSPEEPRVEPTGERVAVRLPGSARARLCGSELAIEFGDFELLVPGGAALAGPLTEVEDAASRQSRREAQAMAALSYLRAGSATGERWAPRQLRLAETAARALARGQRWSELLELTAGVARRAEPAAATILRYRALALRRQERDAEARQLLVRVAKGELESRRPAPGTLYDLADVLAAEGDYDTAIRLIRKADSRLPYPAGERRLRQFEMRRDLEAASRTYRSRHFEIRYPRATGEKYARQVSTVLEHERVRIARWVPRSGSDRIEVDLFPLQQFLSSYGGSVSVAGLFDGRVRVPFADLRSLHPTLVAILSHELSHAMIAAATDDLAPKWFHEGLAQHVEMGTGRVNPLPDLSIQQHAISFPAIEPILAGFAEAQLVDLAYAESAWAVLFVETRWGVAALHRLQRQFATGADTAAAIRAVTGLSLAEFDRAFWSWGTREAPSARSLEVRRYDQELDTPLERAPELAALDRSQRSEPGEAVAPARGLSNPEREDFAAWHATYLALAAPVKTAYKPILEAYRSGTSAPFAADCGRLLVESRMMLTDGRAFSSSDNDVNRTLEEVYRLLGELGESCRDGRQNESRVLYERAGKALSVAAEALAAWDAAP